MCSEKEIEGAHVILHKIMNTSSDKKKPKYEKAVLLYKRTQDACDHPGHWGLIGGKLKPGENPKKGLCREAREELKACGLKKALQSMDCLCRVAIPTNQGQRYIQYFIAELDIEMDELQLKESQQENGEYKVEGEGLAWFIEEEVHHLYMRPEDREALHSFFKK